MTMPEGGEQQFSGEGLDSMVIRLGAAWRSILGAAIVAGLAAALISAALPSAYQATSYVAIGGPEIIVQADGIMSSQFQIPETASLAELAISDAIIEELLGELPALDESATSLEDIRDRLRVRDQGSLLILMAQGSSPETSAEIANGWAKIVAEMINGLYAPSISDRALLEDWAEEANQELQNAREARSTFRSANPVGVIQRRLAGLNEAGATLTQANETLDIARLDASLMQAVLEKSGLAAQTTAINEAQLLVIILEVISAENSLSNGRPSLELGGGLAQLQLQANLQELESRPVGGLVEDIEALIGIIDAKRIDVLQRLIVIDAEAEDLEIQLTQINEESERLEFDMLMASDIYRSIIISLEANSPEIRPLQTIARVASEASAPGSPLGPELGWRVVFAIGIGALLGSIWVLARDWLNRSESEGGKQS